MARKKKQHPHIGMFMADFQGTEGEAARPSVFETPDEALEDVLFLGDAEDVIYVLQVVGVKVVRKPTLTEDLVEDRS